MLGVWQEMSLEMSLDLTPGEFTVQKKLQQSILLPNLFCKRNIHIGLTSRNTHGGHCWNLLVGIYQGTEEYSQEAQLFHPERARALRALATTVCQKNPRVNAWTTGSWLEEDFSDLSKDCVVFAKRSLLCLVHYLNIQVRKSEILLQKKNVKQTCFSIADQVSLIIQYTYLANSSSQYPPVVRHFLVQVSLLCIYTWWLV